MAERGRGVKGGGGQQPPSSAAAGGNGAPPPSAPVDGGEFLLQLLRKPPQSQPSAPAASPLPILGNHYNHRQQHHHHDDPAVAAVGPSHHFSPPNFHDIGRPQIPQWLFPPILPNTPLQQQQPGFSPPGFSPPRFSSPPGFSPPGADFHKPRLFPRGNRGSFFQEEAQQLGFSSGGFGAGDRHGNSGSREHQRNPRGNSQHQLDGFPENMPLFGSRESKQLPERGNYLQSSDLSALSGRAQHNVGNAQRRNMVNSAPGQEGRFVNGPVAEGTGSREPAWNSRSQPYEGLHSRPERGKGSPFPLPDHLRQNELHQRSMVVERARLPGQSNKSKGPEHPAWMNGGRKDGNHGMEKDEDLQKKESRWAVAKYARKETVHTQLHHNVHVEQHGTLLENDRRSTPQSDLEELVEDLHHDRDEEEGISGRQEPEDNDCLEAGSFSSKITLQEQTVLIEQLGDSLATTEEHVEKSEMKNINASRNKDFRSDFSRGNNVSSQRMRHRRGSIECRRDIRRLATSFISIYESLVPAEEEKAKQRQLLSSLEKLVKREWPNAQLHLYGSCANSFGVSNSDIDICLAIDDTEMSKPDILLRLADVLQSDNLQNVQALTRARVPIVKLRDPVSGISCDICVNNLLAVINTKLLRDYAQIDKRLQQLAFIVKYWAKSRGVNETYQGTLSSYAYVQMCIHFLQLRRPAILPCLQGMEATYIITVDDVECAYFDQVEKIRNFGAQNKENIAELLWAFFNYWAFHHDYTNDVISVRTGSIISKQAKDWTRRIGNDRHLICIEDPFEISHDLGRVVDRHSIRILREEFERAANILQFDPNPSVTLFEPYIRESPQD